MAPQVARALVRLREIPTRKCPHSGLRMSLSTVESCIIAAQRAALQCNANRYALLVQAGVTNTPTPQAPVVYKSPPATTAPWVLGYVLIAAAPASAAGPAMHSPHASCFMPESHDRLRRMVIPATIPLGCPSNPYPSAVHQVGPPYYPLSPHPLGLPLLATRSGTLNLPPAYHILS